MNINEAARNHSTFSANYERLFSQNVAQRFFASVLRIAERHDLISDNHLKSFVKKDGSGTQLEGDGRNPTVDFKGEKRFNVTHHSTTDPDARLYKKSEGDKARMSYLSDALMESRNGLVVEIETTLATGMPGRDEALVMVMVMVKRTMKPGRHWVQTRTTTRPC